jgi:hypothetical protein
MKNKTLEIFIGMLLISTLMATSAIAHLAATQPASANTTACPSTSFMNVQADPKNTAYPAPTLTVTCGSSTFVVASNGIPNFEFVQITPNALKAQTYSWTIPLTPASGVTTSIPLVGAVAVAVDGLPIFGPTEAPNMGYSDPYLDGILDFCNGHTAPRGDYHFHARPDCLVTLLSAEKPGTVMGYGFDGVPILSPYVCANTACTTTKKVTSSWKVVNASLTNAWQKHGYVAGQGDLDECNGGLTSAGTYAYFATDSFPYFMGCYRGTVPANTPQFQTTATTGNPTATPTTTPGLLPRAYLPMVTR